MNRQHFFNPASGLGVLLIAAIILLSPAAGRAVDELGQIKDPLKLLKSLEERRLDLDKREKKLAMREEDLARLEKKLAKRIESLEKLRTVIQRDLEKEKEIDDGNIARLAKIYGNMKVKSAAASLQAMDQDTAIKVLKVMSEKTAGKILGKMKGGNAVSLANELGLPIVEKRSRR